MASKIKTIKEYDGKWMVWNSQNNKVADIHKIAEYSLLPTKTKYRVDVAGRTVASGIENFQTAKSRAMQEVK